MKYKGKPVGKRHESHKAFVEQRIYDDRQIVYLAKRKGLRVIRPNGDTRYRGSRRLDVLDPIARRVIWSFEAYLDESATVVYPTPVARF